MDEVAAKQRQINFRVLLIAFILAGIAVVFSRYTAALGVLTGAGMAILNFRLLALGIDRILDLTDPRAAQVQAVTRYVVRYMLVLLVLAMVSLNQNFDMLSTVVGLLLVKAVILGEAILEFIKQQVKQMLDPARWERGD